MTTLIALKTPNYLALISDTSGTLKNNDEIVEITRGHQKLFNFSANDFGPFVIQLTGELTFPTFQTPRPPISAWVNQLIESQKYLNVSSVEEFISEFSKDFVQEWTSKSQFANFVPVIFWISGRTESDEVETFEVYLQHQREFNNLLEIVGVPTPLNFLPNGKSSFQYRSHEEAHGVINYILFGNNQKIDHFFTDHLSADVKFSINIIKCRELAEASKDRQLTVHELEELGKGIVTAISEHGEYLKDNNLRSTAQSPCNVAVISTRKAAFNNLY